MNQSKIVKSDKSSLINWTIIAVSILIGLIVRLKGLGKWPLALDEYYIIKSVQNILEHGLPQFPNGGYYERGILMQYMIAPLIALGVKPEFAGRIFPLIANLLTIPAIYLIAKKVGNQLIATIVIVIFSFSIWEIEFARFIRMYSFFQAVTVWYLYFALLYFETRKIKYYNWMLGLSALSILVFAGSIFLAVFNFVPLVLERKINYKILSIAIIIFAVSFFWNMVGFRFLDPSDPFPQIYYDFVKEKKSLIPIKMPAVLFPFAFKNIITSVSTILLVIINIFLAKKLTDSMQGKNVWSIGSILLLVLLALLNQFGFLLLLFLIFVFWNFINVNFTNRKFFVFLFILLALNSVYWYGFGLLTKEWYVLFDDFSSFRIWGISKRLFMAFFNYPDNYIILLNYFRTIPLLTFFSTVTISLLFLMLLSEKEKNKNIFFLTGTLVFFAVVSSIPRTLYLETRYTFFLVPLLIILVCYSVYLYSSQIFKNRVTSGLSFAAIILIVFVFSKDFSAYHMINIDEADVNYRMIYNNRYKKHLYRRWDVITPAEYVKKHMNKDDLILTNENTMEFYLPKVDYYINNYRHQGFIALSVKRGMRERWSNSKLIYSNDNLLNFIENRKKTLWIVVFPEFYLHEIDFYNRFENNKVYESIDGLVTVFKFEKAAYKAKN